MRREMGKGRELRTLRARWLAPNAPSIMNNRGSPETGIILGIMGRIAMCRRSRDLPTELLPFDGFP